MVDAYEGAPHFAVDSNVIINFADEDETTDPSIERLFVLRRRRWVRLSRADVLDTERTIDQPEEVKSERLAQTVGLPELSGPGVFGSSRYGSAVYPSHEESELLRKIESILPSSGKGPNSLRDAMHLITAAKHSLDGFVTNDKEIGRKAAALDALLGLAVLTPVRAVELCNRMRCTNLELQRQTRASSSPPT